MKSRVGKSYLSLCGEKEEREGEGRKEEERREREGEFNSSTDTCSYIESDMDGAKDLWRSLSLIPVG